MKRLWLTFAAGGRPGSWRRLPGRGKDGGTMKKRAIDACAQVLTALTVAAVLVVLACVAGLLVLGWYTLMSVLHPCRAYHHRCSKRGADGCCNI